MTLRPSLRVLFGVALLAASVLAFQVLLTRVLAAVLFYHFGFVAISLALLGVGGGAVIVYVGRNRFDLASPERALSRWSAGYAVALVLAIFVLVRLNYTYYGITAGFVFNLAAACVVAAIPFFVGGVAIALAVRTYTASIGRLYAFDLVGAGVGAAAVVPLMWTLDAPTLIVGAAGAGAVSSLLFAGARRLDLRIGAAAFAFCAAVLAISLASSLLYIRPVGPAPVAERWTPIARVLAYKPLGSSPNGLVVYDRVIGEIIPYQRGAPLPSWQRVQEGPQSIGYALTGPGKALVIGGGGRDILNALSARQQVDVVELNRGIVAMVDDTMRAFSGGPYSLPGVHTTVGDGRSTVQRISTHYDTVHLGFTDTYSANSAQAFALTENNLYTVEAFQAYLDHLTANGVLNVSRPIRANQNEALRLTVLTLDALRRHGVARPQDNVIVIRGHYSNPFNAFDYGTVLARLRPYTPQEIARVAQLAQQRGGHVVYAPGGPYVGDWGALAAASSPLAFCSQAAYNYCPPSDDKPFFFNLLSLSDLFHSNTRGSLSTPDPLVVLMLTLVILLVIATVALLVPLALTSRATRPSARSLGYFGLIGMGFLIIEVVLIQRFVLFLGFPTYSLSVVLCGLLVFTGLGAWASGRSRAGERVLPVAMAAAVVLMLACAFGLQPLLASLISLPFALRVVITLALVAPLGVLLGTAMPLGLSRLAARSADGVPWAWAANGFASVLGSVLAIAIAINYGYRIATLVAAACYVGAFGYALAYRRPRHDKPAETTPEPHSSAKPVGVA